MVVKLENFRRSVPMPLRREVASALRKAILDGDIPPGERLIETDLAEMMNVSRMPVREALRMLENEGLVQHIPRIGLVTVEFSEQDIREIYAIREALEAYAITIVVQKATEEDLDDLEKACDAEEKCRNSDNIKQLFKSMANFNDLLYKSCNMSRLIDQIVRSQEYLQHFRNKLMRSPERCTVALNEHRELLYALRDRDEDRSVSIIRRHLRGALKSYLEIRAAEDMEKERSVKKDNRP